MELWDVYDELRQPAGRTAVRGEPPAEGDCMLVVHVCLFNAAGELLIQQRQRTKRSFPGCWDVSVAGGVLAGETVREAAIRETREELGVTPDLRNARPYVSLAFENGFDDYFLLDYDAPLSAFTIQREELLDLRWAPREEIRAMLERGEFAPYYGSFLDLLFDLRRHMGLSR